MLTLIRVNRPSRLLSVAIVSVALLVQGAFACTGIVLSSADGVTVPARTMEFSFDIKF